MKIIIRILLLVIFTIAVVMGISYLLSGGQHEIINHVRINKSPEEVFDFVSDMRNELKWNPDVIHMEKVTDGNVGMGTRFRAKWHLSDTILVTIQRFEKPRHVTFVNGGPIEVTLDLTLNSVDSSTEMESRFIATPHGFMRVIFPIFKMQMEKQERINMENLKRALEK